MRIFVAHSSNFDFKKKIYEPLRASELNTHHQIFLPHEGEKEEVTRDLIKSCDLVIGDISMPSTGLGIELGWADAFQVPILCIYEKGTEPSGSAQFLTKDIIEYSNQADLLAKLTAHLK